MLIFGHEYGFMFTVQASMELAEICPEKKLENLEQLFTDDNATGTMMAAAKMAEILSRGYEQNKKFSDPTHEIHVLTAEMALALPYAKFAELQKATMESISTGKETEIELETPKKNTAQGAEVKE